MSKPKYSSLKLATEPTHKGPGWIVELFVSAGKVRYYYLYTRQQVRAFKETMKKGQKAHIFRASFNYVQGFKKNG